MAPHRRRIRIQNQWTVKHKLKHIAAVRQKTHLCASQGCKARVCRRRVSPKVHIWEFIFSSGTILVSLRSCGCEAPWPSTLYEKCCKNTTSLTWLDTVNMHNSLQPCTEKQMNKCFWLQWPIWKHEGHYTRLNNNNDGTFPERRWMLAGLFLAQMKPDYHSDCIVLRWDSPLRSKPPRSGKFVRPHTVDSQSQQRRHVSKMTF